MSILFLFGAGASHGSEKDLTSTPALGDSLYQALRAQFPLTWGKLDKKYGDLFRVDFEKGMNLVLAHYPRDVSELQRDMAKYFFNFHPSPENLYIRIIERLGIKDISFVSLNYDRLLEEAILRSGFFPNYGLKPNTEREVGLYLPHGCCNLFLEGFDIPPGAVSFDYISGQFDSGRIRIIRSYNEFQNEIASRAFPPGMACFDPRKTSALGKKFLDMQKMRFEKMVQSAELIVIVGVNVRVHDNHVWSPLARTSAKLIYCSGEGAKLFEAWHDEFRAEKNDLTLPRYFADHFEEICNIVGSTFATCAQTAAR